MLTESIWRKSLLSKPPVDDPDDCGGIFDQILNESEPEIFLELFARQKHFATMARLLATGLTGADRAKVLHAALEPFIAFPFRAEISAASATWIHDRYFAEDPNTPSTVLRDSLTARELEVNERRVHHFEFLVRNMILKDPRLTELASRIFYYGLHVERHAEGGLVVALKRVPR